MAILGRGITGLSLSTDHILVGTSGVIDELPPGTLNQVLTITAGGVDWADPTGGTGAVNSINGLTGTIVLNLNDINDVDVGSPNNQDVLTFNNGTGLWEASPAPGSSGGETNDGLNVGTGASVFLDKSLTFLRFRSIIGGTNTTITENVDNITIDTVGEVNAAVNLGSGIGVFRDKSLEDLRFKTLVAGTNVTLDNTTNINEIVINASAPSAPVDSVNGQTGIVVINLDDLNDIISAGAASGQVLSYNGTNWVPTNAADVNAEQNTVSNTGIGVGIFKQKTGVDFELRSIATSGGITAALSGDTNTIELTGSGGTVTNITAGVGLTGGPITTTGTIDFDFDSLTVDSNPDTVNDKLAYYDNSTGEHKSITMDSLLTAATGDMLLASNSLSELTATAATTRSNIGAASDTALTSHINNFSNPHNVSASQTGALPTTGGVMTGNITLGTNAEINSATGENLIISAATNRDVLINGDDVVIRGADGFGGALTLDNVGNIQLRPTTGFNLTLGDDIVMPFSLGSIGQILRVDASGTALEFVNQSGGLGNVVDDLTPELGGNLDALNNSIVNLLDPTSNQDAATKKYVDDSIFGISVVNTLNDLTDVDLITNAPAQFDVLQYDGSEWIPTTLSTGATNFVELNDTPATFTSHAGKALQVNVTEDAIEYVSLSTVATTGSYTDLIDNPTVLSDFTNDTNFITSTGAPVQSVAGKSGAVTLVAADITDFPTLVTDINDLSDVAITTPANGEVLTYNGSDWVAQVPPSATNFIGLTDTPATFTSQDGKALRVNSGGTAVEFFDLTLDSLTDTIIGTPADGQVLTYNTTLSQWVPETPTGGSNSFTNLTDTPGSYTGNANRAITVNVGETGLEFTTLPTALSDFTNDESFITSAGAPVQSVASKTGAVTLVAADIGGLSTVATTNDYTDLDNLPTIPPVAPVDSVAGKTGAVTLVLDDNTNVDTTGAANSNVLTYNGTTWVAAAPTGGGASALNDLTDVTIGTPSDGDVLIYNSGSGQWLPGAQTGGSGGGSTSERVRLVYAPNGDLTSFDNKTAGIGTTTILSPTGGNVEISFVGHAYPPSSIIIYGYASASNEYLIKVVDANITTRKIAGGGVSGSPTSFGSFTGPMTLTLKEAETGASRNFGTGTEAWIVFQFSD